MAETEEFLKQMKETARQEALAQAKQEEAQRKIAEEREKAIDRRLTNRTGASSNRRRNYFIPDLATDGVEVIKDHILFLQEKLIPIPIAAPLPEEQQEAIRSILSQLAKEQQKHRAMYADIQYSLAQLDEELYEAADVQLAEQLLAELEELKEEVVAILTARGEQLAAYEPASNSAETAAYQELAKALSNPANVEAIASNSQEQMRALLNKRSHQGNSSALSTAAKELAAVMAEVVKLLRAQYRAIEDLYLSPAYDSPGARAYLNQNIAEDVHQLKRLRSAIKDIEQSLINLCVEFWLPFPRLTSSLPTSQAALQAAIQTILASIPVRGSELIQSDRFLEGISNAWKNMTSYSQPPGEQAVATPGIHEPQLPNASAAAEAVKSYLQANQGTASAAPQQAQGAALLQAVEALKKEIKAHYRATSKTFVTTDISEHVWAELMQQQASHKQELATLRSLRAQLQQALASEAASSSDDEQLYSRQALKEKQAFAQGIGETLQGRIDGLVDMLRDPQATVESYVALLGAIPHLPALIDQYVNEFLYELDEEARAERLGQLLTEAVLLLVPQANLLNLAGISKKLGKAAGKVGKGITSIIKGAGLPTSGKIRFIPRPADVQMGKLLQKEGGYVDKFGNIWRRPKGNIRNEIHWDVQLSPLGKKQLGHLSSRDRKSVV